MYSAKNIFDLKNHNLKKMNRDINIWHMNGSEEIFHPLNFKFSLITL